MSSEERKNGLIRSKSVWSRVGRSALRVLPSFGVDVAADMGSDNFRLYVSGKGVVEDEPSMVLVKCNPDTRRVERIVSMGRSAHRLRGVTPSDLECIWPIRSGVISDFNLASEMFRASLRRAGMPGFLTPVRTLLMPVPTGATQVDRRAVRDVAERASASRVLLVETVFAAALGAGLPLEEPQGSMVINIGAGTTEVGVLSYFGSAVKDSSKVGGDRFKFAISQFLRRSHGLLIDESTAEQVKVAVGQAYPGKDLTTIPVTGRCLTSGLPRTVTVTGEEVRSCFSELIGEIVSLVRITLEQTPPKLLADVAKSHIVLTGGASLLSGLDRVLEESTQMKVVYADDPKSAVIRGCAKMLSNLDRYSPVCIT